MTARDRALVRAVRTRLAGWLAELGHGYLAEKVRDATCDAEIDAIIAEVDAQHPPAPLAREAALKVAEAVRDACARDVADGRSGVDGDALGPHGDLAAIVDRVLGAQSEVEAAERRVVETVGRRVAKAYERVVKSAVAAALGAASGVLPNVPNEVDRLTVEEIERRIKRPDVAFLVAEALREHTSLRAAREKAGGR